MQSVLIVMMVISIPLNLIVFKKRKLAALLLYYEFARIVIEGLIPMDGWNIATDHQNMLIYFTGFLCLYTHQIGHLFYPCVSYGVFTLVVKVIIFRDELTVQKIVF